MIWVRMLAYITGTVDQELLLRNEYLAAENRILRAQCKGRLLLSDAKKATLAEIAQRLARKALEELAAVAPDTLQEGSGAVSGATGRSAEVLRARGHVGVEVGTACHVWQSHIYIKDACSLAQAKGLASLIYH